MYFLNSHLQGRFLLLFRNVLTAAVHVAECLAACLADVEIILCVSVVLAKPAVYGSGACGVMAVDRFPDPVI